ncbi:unnamed protein product [Chondrus crispus]|uniref:Uncharacterized protein n=1 Tax=Chondrus crispus TaxID=2769 RepID=R7QNY7_CHOCR|nr:unnamed protein product [Chondrus crispus]CDF39201.1 unnamed protein product [Chondrus crispus]|eukprot:XP_005719112.1 unnamed protein product [Chondrus crispus]
MTRPSQTIIPDPNSNYPPSTPAGRTTTRTITATQTSTHTFEPPSPAPPTTSPLCRTIKPTSKHLLRIL